MTEKEMADALKSKGWIVERENMTITFNRAEWLNNPPEQFCELVMARMEKQGVRLPTNKRLKRCCCAE